MPLLCPQRLYGIGLKYDKMMHQGGMRVDLALIVYFGYRLSLKCREAGVPAFAHVAKFVGSWLVCEIMGSFIFMELGFDFTLLVAIGAVLLGAGAGFLSYRKSLRELNQHNSDVPRLPQ
jgi:hypothetical protein